MAFPYDGGVHWQEAEQRIAMWYLCGGTAFTARFSGTGSPPLNQERVGRSEYNSSTPFANTGVCLAFSTDGVLWTKPAQDVCSGTNRVFWHGNPLPAADKGLQTSVSIVSTTSAFTNPLTKKFG